MKRNRVKPTDGIKASRRGSREAEIEFYGRQLSHRKIHRSKKTYDRKKQKADLRRSPFDFLRFSMPVNQLNPYTPVRKLLKIVISIY